MCIFAGFMCMCTYIHVYRLGVGSRLEEFEDEEQGRKPKGSLEVSSFGWGGSEKVLNVKFGKPYLKGPAAGDWSRSEPGRLRQPHCATLGSLAAPHGIRVCLQTSKFSDLLYHYSSTISGREADGSN